MTQFSEDLRALRFSPTTGRSDDDFVARVMAACTAEPVREVLPAPKRRSSRRTAWTYGALAAAACVAIGVAVWPPNRPNEVATVETIAARGNPDAGLTATVQAFVGHATPGAAPALLEGATLHPGDGILVRYSNPSARDVYLMVFAVDEQRNVHWIHPAYLDEKSNPTSLKLDQRVTDRVLPEVAEPENPALGQLQVYAVLSALPLDVKSVEGKVAISARPVSELFPQAEVEEWKCTWSAP
jgi:hypothetical protein